MEHLLNLNYMQVINNLKIIEARENDVETIRFHAAGNPFAGI